MLDPHEIERVKKLLARPASVIEAPDFSAVGAMMSSWFGRVNVGLPDETWPTYKDRPMLPLLQLNLREAPYVPPGLADLSLITVFLAPDELPNSTPNGDGWLLRPYSQMDGLQPVSAPADAYKAGSEFVWGGDGPVRPFPIKFRLLESDYPSFDDLPPDIIISDALDEAWFDHFNPAEGLKLGGWPSLIQRETALHTRSELRRLTG